MGGNGNKQLLDKKATNWFRGIAAIMVVLSHYAEWWSWFTPSEEGMEIFRIALTKLGTYGVDIFLLFSGYAMVKSLGQERMYPEFIWKRFKNVYIPYFIVVGIIKLLSGGFTSLQDFWNFISGYNYWYMLVLFIFYIGFIVIWTIVGGRGARIITLAIFTYVFSYILYKRGMYDFWYVSNITFVLGVIAGEYEEKIKQIMDKAGIYLILALACMMIPIICAGLPIGTGISAGPDKWEIYKEIGANTVWTVLVLALAAKWRFYDSAMITIGKSSLYIYLTHTYIFMRCVNNLEFSFAVRFMISAVITVMVSILCNILLSGRFKPYLFRRKREKG